ncbi:hypothetical protein QQF64_012709 [Cirrhinus molitorella]|uniref:Uncharacterized protein n=1 Tax=Cirrhinus molitorella TaxID=172907 RepID=A0ABR3LWB2_9TELE
MISGSHLDHPLAKTSNIRTEFDFAVRLFVFHSCLEEIKQRALSAGEIMHRSFIRSCIKLNIICRIGHATEPLQCWRV